MKHVTSADSATARMAAARESRNRLVHERNLWMALATRMYPAHLTPARGERGSGTWRTVVCLHHPSIGQIATRITDDDLHLFAHLAESPDDWDRHTYTDKIARLEQLATAQWQPSQKKRR